MSTVHDRSVATVVDVDFRNYFIDPRNPIWGASSSSYSDSLADLVSICPDALKTWPSTHPRTRPKLLSASDPSRRRLSPRDPRRRYRLRACTPTRPRIRLMRDLGLPRSAEPARLLSRLCQMPSLATSTKQTSARRYRHAASRMRDYRMLRRKLQCLRWSQRVPRPGRDVSPVLPPCGRMHRSARDASFCYTDVADVCRD